MIRVMTWWYVFPYLPVVVYSHIICLRNSMMGMDHRGVTPPYVYDVVKISVRSISIISDCYDI